MEDIIGIILNNWTGLKMCIEHGMGGNNQLVGEKIQGMIEILMEQLNHTTVSWENISDVLEEQMDVQFNTILEDDSPDEIAKVICELFYFWRENDQHGLNAKMNQMCIKIPIQQEYQPSPQVPPTRYQSDTVGNTYAVQEIKSDDEWTEVKYRR